MKSRYWMATLFALFLGVIHPNPPGGLAPWLHEAHAADSEVLYTCGMHPQIIQKKPGNCPICGMKLTLLRKASTNAASTNTFDSTASPSVITINPVTIQNMNLRTAVITNGPLERVVRTVGIVDYDETSLVEVTTKYRGWIEKLHVNATGQKVQKGEPLFEIYSPDLFSAQTEYLLQRQQPGFDARTSSALMKLRYFDVPDTEITRLDQSGQARKTMTVLAPRDGIVLEKMAVEGQMVNEGMRLYRIADLSVVWVLAQVFEKDLPWVRLGQDASISLDYLPDRKFQGRVTFVYPSVDEQTRTVKVRLELQNRDALLKPGMFASVDLQARMADSVPLVPDMAILHSGVQNTVFVALEGGRFEPRSVQLGPRTDAYQYQILSGLKPGEHIVISGQFLLDSESQLREAIQKFSSMHEAAAPAHASPPAPVPALYTCPMEADADVVSDHPGDCPKCGMKLVPVSQVAHRKIAEDNWRKQHEMEKH